MQARTGGPRASVTSNLRRMELPTPRAPGCRGPQTTNKNGGGEGNPQSLCLRPEEGTGQPIDEPFPHDRRRILEFLESL